jgi:Holliday junction resolvase
VNAARKGAKGERELAALLTELLGVPCIKGSAPYLPGIVAPDILGLPGIHVEVKRREKFSIPAALRQAQHDAVPGSVATVAHRPNRCNWMLTVAIEDLPALVRAVEKIVEGKSDAKPA